MSWVGVIITWLRTGAGLGDNKGAVGGPAGDVGLSEQPQLILYLIESFLCAMPAVQGAPGWAKVALEEVLTPGWPHGAALVPSGELSSQGAAPWMCWKPFPEDCSNRGKYFSS